MKKKVNKKIHLSKITISNLNSGDMNGLKGGVLSRSCPQVTCDTDEANCTDTCISVFPFYCTDPWGTCV